MKIKSKSERRVHLALGMLLFAMGIFLVPFSLTGSIVLESSPINFNFLPVVAFLVAIFEIYLGVKVN
jgi:hypothetical protein